MIKNFEQYQEAVNRLECTQNDLTSRITEYAIGASGEVGELVNIIKKEIFHGHEAEVGKIAEEIGDVFWYLTALAGCYGIELGEIATKNIEKLKKRYPDGFSTEASVNRVV